MTFADKDEEVAYWKAAAIYLAECHAATSESVVKMDETTPHKPMLSTYDRKRFLHIAGICSAILDSDTMEELKGSKEEIWAFLGNYLGAPDLERLRKRVAMRAKDSLDD